MIGRCGGRVIVAAPLLRYLGEPAVSPHSANTHGDYLPFRCRLFFHFERDDGRKPSALAARPRRNRRHIEKNRVSMGKTGDHGSQQYSNGSDDLPEFTQLRFLLSLNRVQGDSGAVEPPTVPHASNPSTLVVTNPLTTAPRPVCNGLAAAKSAAGSTSPVALEARLAPPQKALFSCPAHGVRPCGGAVREPFGAAGCSSGWSCSPYGPASTRLQARETALPTLTLEGRHVHCPPAYP